MIEIEDKDIPANAAPLTVAEVLDGLQNKTLSPTRGDMILELRSRTSGKIEARIWLGKEGVITVDGLRLFVRSMAFGSTYNARVLWIAHPERLN